MRRRFRLTYEGAPKRMRKSKGENMKFLLMMNTMKAGMQPFPGWTKKDIQAHVAFMRSFAMDLKASSELVSAEGLAFPEEAKQVRAGKDGEPITDGVFPESKEFLAGFWIVDVQTPERAYAIAACVSAAPGANGAALNMPIEVRQVMSGPPPEFL
jgi:hypothetical protein